MSEASRRITASRTSTRTNPSASVNGRRSAATIGGSTAFRIAISAAAMNASPTPWTVTCGTIAAATPTAAADTIQLIASLNGLKRGVSGFQTTSSPYVVSSSRSVISAAIIAAAGPAIVILFGR